MVGHPPEIDHLKFAPRLEFAPPTGATALLVQHEPNHHSHNDAANHLDSDVPEEVSHGVPSFQESAPQRFSILSLFPCQRTTIRTPRRISAYFLHVEDRSYHY